jgi:hypothetical protein
LNFICVSGDEGIVMLLVANVATDNDVVKGAVRFKLFDDDNN